MGRKRLARCVFWAFWGRLDGGVCHSRQGKESYTQEGAERGTKGRPARLIMASVIAAKPGVEFLKKIFPSNDVMLYCAAIDPTLNEHKYIVPGLGDAGDLMYGDKL